MQCLLAGFDPFRQSDQCSFSCFFGKSDKCRVCSTGELDGEPLDEESSSSSEEEDVNNKQVDNFQESDDDDTEPLSAAMSSVDIPAVPPVAAVPVTLKMNKAGSSKSLRVESSPEPCWGEKRKEAPEGSKGSTSPDPCRAEKRRGLQGIQSFEACAHHAE